MTTINDFISRTRRLGGRGNRSYENDIYHIFRDIYNKISINEKITYYSFYSSRKCSFSLLSNATFCLCIDLAEVEFIQAISPVCSSPEIENFYFDILLNLIGDAFYENNHYAQCLAAKHLFALKSEERENMTNWENIDHDQISNIRHNVSVFIILHELCHAIISNKISSNLLHIDKGALTEYLFDIYKEHSLLSAENSALSGITFSEATGGETANKYYEMLCADEVLNEENLSDILALSILVELKDENIITEDCIHETLFNFISALAVKRVMYGATKSQSHTPYILWTNQRRLISREILLASYTNTIIKPKKESSHKIMRKLIDPSIYLANNIWTMPTTPYLTKSDNLLRDVCEEITGWNMKTDIFTRTIQT